MSISALGEQQLWQPSPVERAVLARPIVNYAPLIVTGLPVDPSVARHLIGRLDHFFVRPAHGGRDPFPNQLRAALGLPLDHSPAAYAAQEAWRAGWGYLATEYLATDWVYSGYIDGPHGWIHPSGRIGYVDGVGKHPRAESLAAEWAGLAARYPTLELDITLRRQPDDPGSPAVIGLRVRRGTLEVCDPATTPLHHGHPPAQRTDAGTHNWTEADGIDGIAPCGIPADWVTAWAAEAAARGLVAPQ